MVRVWLSLIGVAACSVLVLSLGGCPEGSSTNGAGDNLNSGAGDLTDDPQGLEQDEGLVLGALVVAVEDDEDGVDDQPTDEQPYFGEDPSLYTEVDADAAVLSDDNVLPSGDADSEGTQTSQRFVRAHGALAGRFSNTDPNSTVDAGSGVFRGRWFSSDGTVLGYLRGQYAPLAAADVPSDLASAGYFHGKYIDSEGRFMGFLQGKYGRTQNGRRMFVGREFDADKQQVGLMKGHWGDPLSNIWADSAGTVLTTATATVNATTTASTARTQELSGGVFAGRWVVFNVCDEDDTLPDYEFDPNDFGGFDTSDETLSDADLADVDDAGEAVQEGSPARDDDVALCVDPEGSFGFLAGWYTGPDENADGADGSAGLFRGRWRAADRRSFGVLIGRFEELDTPVTDGETAHENAADPNAPAERGAMVLGVFYGKYVDTTGAFRGFIRGAFGRSRNGLGVFRGSYFDATGAEAGVLFGRYNPYFDVDGSLFRGVWNGRALEDQSTE